MSKIHEGMKGGRWAARRAEDRNVDELLGLCRGVMLDGSVNQSEIEGLVKWLELNADALERWPGNAIYPRLIEALSDGNLSPDEESSISALLLNVVGNEHVPDPFEMQSSALPCDDPAPKIIHGGMRFCITGEFVRAQRSVVVSMIEASGGIAVQNVSAKIQYLIVGLAGSAEWKHGSFGTKIMKAMELRAAGKPIKIVSEKHWLESLDASRRTA